MPGQGLFGMCLVISLGKFIMLAHTKVIFKS